MLINFIGVLNEWRRQRTSSLWCSTFFHDQKRLLSPKKMDKSCKEGVHFEFIRRNLMNLSDILHDPKFVLNHCVQNKLITMREYKEKKVDLKVESILELMLLKGEDSCQKFISLVLKNSSVQETYPRLQESYHRREEPDLEWASLDSPPLPLVQAPTYSPSTSTQMPPIPAPPPPTYLPSTSTHSHFIPPPPPPQGPHQATAVNYFSANLTYLAPSQGPHSTQKSNQTGSLTKKKPPETRDPPKSKATKTPATTKRKATKTPATTKRKATKTPATPKSKATKTPATTKRKATKTPATTKRKATKTPATTKRKATKTPATTKRKATKTPATLKSKAKKKTATPKGKATKPKRKAPGKT